MQRALLRLVFIYVYIDRVVAIGDNGLMPAPGAAYIDALGVSASNNISLVIVVVVDAMVPRRCPVVEHIAGLQSVLPVAVRPAAVPGTHYVRRPGLIGEIVHFLVDLAVKGEQREAWLVGNGDLEALRRIDLHGGLGHIVGEDAYD